MDAADDQLRSIKDVIYRAGYDFGLVNAGISDNHELHSRTVLCLPRAFTAIVVNPCQALPADEEDENAKDNSQPHT